MTNITLQHPTTLTSFARAVVFSNIESVLYFFEKPYKWQKEFDKWIELGQPTSVADDNWEAWQDFLTGGVEAGTEDNGD